MPNLGVAVVRQYERGVVFRVGRLRGVREPGIRFMIPLVDNMKKVKLRTVTMPISDHPVALQLRNLQVLSEIAIEKNSTIVFPAQFLDSIQTLTEFVARERAAEPLVRLPAPREPVP